MYRTLSYSIVLYFTVFNHALIPTQAYRALFNLGNLLRKAEAYGRVAGSVVVGGVAGTLGAVLGGAFDGRAVAVAPGVARPSRMAEAVDVFQRAVHLVPSGADAYFQLRRLLPP